ncbi:glycosyltransferase family 2 protein [Flavobacterium sp. PS2]|uniref:glycosyltransferase family 2 protein n=1 Tax=Flavobacterium sp. PS2 TaxID=3384157 RepID=UPI00390CCE86
MLSILIPVYNYDVCSLITELHKQCLQSGIEFEIICLDDASSQFLTENQKLNQLTNSSYAILDKNIGRSAIRNLLAQKANFEDLLFLDADTLPIHSNFITNYILQINKDEKVIYGGIQYQKEEPTKSEILRWIYGKSREALSVEKRQISPYLSLLTLNFLIKKSIFKKVFFNEEIPNLRHEDTLFSFELKQNKIEVIHIENPVYHLGIESSKTFLKKSEESVIGLKYLVDEKLIGVEYVKLSYYYQIVKKYKLSLFLEKLFLIFKSSLKKNLLSDNPSLFIFDLYRLGYYFTLKK